MDVLKEKYGKVVPNDGVSLGKELGVTDIWHAGNFQFGAKLWGVEVDIATEPVDEEAEEIRILSVRMEESALQREGIYRHKIGITYRMNRGSEAAESFINLPVSAERYAELAQGLRPDSKAWRAVQGALKQIAYLQGYKLGSWSIELQIETGGEGADND